MLALTGSSEDVSCGQLPMASQHARVQFLWPRPVGLAEAQIEFIGAQVYKCDLFTLLVTPRMLITNYPRHGKPPLPSIVEQSCLLCQRRHI
jgi:hypothetical protein